MSIVQGRVPENWEEDEFFIRGTKQPIKWIEDMFGRRWGVNTMKTRYIEADDQIHMDHGTPLKCSGSINSEKCSSDNFHIYAVMDKLQIKCAKCGRDTNVGLNKWLKGLK